jgi:hypothetical protein
MSDERAAEAAKTVRRLGVEKPLRLVTVDLARAVIAEERGVSPATARRWVLAAVDAGLLTAFRPHADWSVAYAIPGNQEWVGMDVYAHREESMRLSTTVPRTRPPLPYVMFLAHEEQLAELGRIWAAEARARAAEGRS